MAPPPDHRELRHIDPDDPAAARFGGKALGLARLLRSDLPSPDGFAIAATLEPPERWAPALRHAFEDSCKRLLGQGPVAVRSSAPDEDGRRRSFAGQYVTVLDVTDLDGAVQAAQRCIASGGSERVRAYAGRVRPTAVGVVVQSMVAASSAGVVLTRDPDGRDAGMAVEAVRGRGEELVSGRATPERWRVYRAGTGQFEAQLAAAAPSGPAALQERQALSLGRAAWTLARRWKQDLDLEWAFDARGMVWWLQARPVTATARWEPWDVRRSALTADDGPVSVWTNVNLRENLAGPLRPLTWSVWSEALGPILVRDLVGVGPGTEGVEQASALDRIQGRAYFNLNALLASPALGRALPWLLGFLDARGARTVRDLIDRGVLRRRQLPGSGVKRLLRHLGRLLSLAWRSRTALRPDRALASLQAASDTVAQRPALAELKDPELLGELSLADAPELAPLWEGLSMVNAAFATWVLAERLFAPWPEAQRVLGAGATDNPTTAISMGIEALTASAGAVADVLLSPAQPLALLARLREVAGEDEAAATWLKEFDAFLATYGHRAPAEFELATPRWIDDPALVVELVREGLRHPRTYSLGPQVEELRDTRARKIEAAVAAAPAWRRPLMRWAAARVPLYMPLREAPKHHLMRVMLRVRHVALELGRRLVGAGTLARADDVWFFERTELKGLLEGQARVGGRSPSAVADERRGELLRFAERTPPDFVRSDGVPVLPAEGTGAGLPAGPAVPALPAGALQGVGIGGGRAEGPARILSEPDPRRLHRGDVLVVRHADPGWTPLFSLASAVVMEVGGALCHAAVVAREFGVPAVFGVADATTRLRDDEVVTVDGDLGRVLPAPQGRYSVRKR